MFEIYYYRCANHNTQYSMMAGCNGKNYSLLEERYSHVQPIRGGSFFIVGFE